MGRTPDPPQAQGPSAPLSALPCGSGQAIGLSGSDPRGDGHRALLGCPVVSAPVSNGRQNEGRPQDMRSAFSGKGLRELGYLVISGAQGVCPPVPPGTCTEPFSVMGRPAPKGGEWRPRPLPAAPAATTKTASGHVPWRDKRAT